MNEELHSLPVSAIKTICQIYFPCSQLDQNSLYQKMSQVPEVIQTKICQMAHQMIESGIQLYSRQVWPVLPATPADNYHDVEETNIPSLSNHIIREKLCDSESKQALMTEVINAAIAEFIDHTGNGALALGTCASCTRETLKTNLSYLSFSKIPNKKHLSPETPHHSHTIYNGMLLHPAGVLNDSTACLCSECLKSLQYNQLPMFLLANNLWIGDTPRDLSILTLPEHMLIAKYFSSAYIVKLYPKKVGTCFWDRSQMHSSLRGNVSTYQLDQSQTLPW
jgi:hypothetical protein